MLSASIAVELLPPARCASRSRRARRESPARLQAAYLSSAAARLSRRTSRPGDLIQVGALYLHDDALTVGQGRCVHPAIEAEPSGRCRCRKRPPATAGVGLRENVPPPRSWHGQASRRAQRLEREAVFFGQNVRNDGQNLSEFDKRRPEVHTRKYRAPSPASAPERGDAFCSMATISAKAWLVELRSGGGRAKMARVRQCVDAARLSARARTCAAQVVKALSPAGSGFAPLSAARRT